MGKMKEAMETQAEESINAQVAAEEAAEAAKQIPDPNE